MYQNENKHLRSGGFSPKFTLYTINKYKFREKLYLTISLPFDGLMAAFAFTGYLKYSFQKLYRPQNFIQNRNFIRILHTEKYWHFL